MEIGFSDPIGWHAASCQLQDVCKFLGSFIRRQRFPKLMDQFKVDIGYHPMVLIMLRIFPYCNSILFRDFRWRAKGGEGIRRVIRIDCLRMVLN